MEHQMWDNHCNFYRVNDLKSLNLFYTAKSHQEHPSSQSSKVVCILVLVLHNTTTSFRLVKKRKGGKANAFTSWK